METIYDRNGHVVVVEVNANGQTCDYFSYGKRPYLIS